jgi:hypothetical protein
MQQTNEEICKQLLAKLPHDFYGSIELNFHKGILMWAKTIITTKFNPERATAETNNDYLRK